MGQCQLGRFQHDVIHQEQIEINRPRRIAERPRAPQITLDRQELAQQDQRRQLGLQRDHRVEKGRLFQIADRRRVVQRGDGDETPRLVSRRTASRRVAIRSPRFAPSPMYAVAIAYAGGELMGGAPGQVRASAGVPRTTASVMRATRAIARTSCTRTMSAPRDGQAHRRRRALQPIVLGHTEHAADRALA